MKKIIKVLLCLGIVAGFVALVTNSGKGDACPFCTMQGQTLVGEVNQASMVLFGNLKNAKLGNADGTDGTTEFEVLSVIKDHPIRKQSKSLTLPRYVPPDKDGKYKFLLFCEVYKEKLDPYRGVAIPPDSDIVKYLQGALALKDQPVAKKLGFYFDYRFLFEP